MCRMGNPFDWLDQSCLSCVDCISLWTGSNKFRIYAITLIASMSIVSALIIYLELLVHGLIVLDTEASSVYNTTTILFNNMSIVINETIIANNETIAFNETTIVVNDAYLVLNETAMALQAKKDRTIGIWVTIIIFGMYSTSVICVILFSVLSTATRLIGHGEVVPQHEESVVEDTTESVA